MQCGVHRKLSESVVSDNCSYADSKEAESTIRMSTISRLSRTYGTSFMILVVLGYFTVGLRCFPWLAMTYWFKDTLKVSSLSLVDVTLFAEEN